jgi:hypothetical protein
MLGFLGNVTWALSRYNTEAPDGSSYVGPKHVAPLIHIIYIINRIC